MHDLIKQAKGTLTVVEFAKKAGVSSKTLVRFGNCKLHKDTLERIADAVEDPALAFQIRNFNLNSYIKQSDLVNIISLIRHESEEKILTLPYTFMEKEECYQQGVNDALERLYGLICVHN